MPRFYDESRNTEGGYIAGVPLGDMTDEQYGALPDWLQKQVDGVGWYRKTPIRAEKPDKEKAESKPKAADKPADAPQATEQGTEEGKE